MQLVHTFSIVAYDPGKKEWGAAVQSKFLAAAAVVSWAEANAGAVATQSFANVTYGRRGLDLMAAGTAADEVLDILIKDDPDRDLRQVGVVDRSGKAAAFTGKDCHDWAGHIVGEGFSCQGNILVPGTIEAMAECFQRERKGDGELADWLVAALAAGQQAGGDQRGRQAAGVLVVREKGGYGGDNDRYLDLRVDDHSSPIEKLADLVQSHHLFFGEVDPADLISLQDHSREIREVLILAGENEIDPQGPFTDRIRKSLRSLVGKENLEERWDGEGEMIDRNVIDYLQKRLSTPK